MGNEDVGRREGGGGARYLIGFEKDDRPGMIVAARGGNWIFHR